MQEPEGEPGATSRQLVDAVIGASRVLVTIAARSLSDAGEDVTLTQYRSLVVLASRGAQGVAELAEALAVTPPTASRLVDRLVRKRLVRRRSDGADRRQVRVTLTAAGRRLVDRVTEARRREVALLFDALPEEDRHALVHSPLRLADAAGEVPDAEWSAGWDL